MKVSEEYPSKYLSGFDLPGPVTVTIDKLESELLNKPGERGPVKTWIIFCRGKKKGIILSKFLAKQIANMLGDDSDQWIGKQITIYPEPMKVAGREVVALRARAVEPQS